MLEYGFKTGSGRNLADGIGDRWERLISAGKPIVHAAIGGAGFVYEAQQRSNHPLDALHFRTEGKQSEITPLYNIQPHLAAAILWEWHTSRWPPELDPRRVAMGITNEPAAILRKDELLSDGYPRRYLGDDLEGHPLYDNAEWMAELFLHLSQYALTNKRRITLFDWSPGEPDFDQWKGPRMLELLDLARKNPEWLWLGLHNYTMKRAPSLVVPAWTIGRHIMVPELAGIKKYITEIGWTLKWVPDNVDVAMAELEKCSALYHRNHDVVGAAIWYLGAEGHSWEQVANRVWHYMEPLTDIQVSTPLPDPRPPAPPQPPQPPAPEPDPEPSDQNLLYNGSFELGHYDEVDIGEKRQVPNGWELYHGDAMSNQIDPSPGAAYKKPEMRILNEDEDIPVEERGLFVTDGRHVYKVFRAWSSYLVSLSQRIPLGPGTYRASVDVFADLYKDYDNGKVPANDPLKRDGIIALRYGGLTPHEKVEVSETFNLSPLESQTLEFEFTLDREVKEALFSIVMHSPFPLEGNAMFIDNARLVRVPDTQPEPEPEPPKPEMVLVADISYHQDDPSTPGPDVDFEEMRAAGVEGVIIRGSHGLLEDERVADYVAGAKAAGLPHTLYGYYYPWHDAIAQADLFVATVKKYGTDFLPAVDLEETREIRGVVYDDTFRANVRRYVERVAYGLGYKPIIYTSPFYASTYLRNAPWMASYLLWIANWTTRDEPIVPKPWDDWEIWQYTSKAPGGQYGVHSDHIDLNRVRRADWEFLIKTWQAPEPEPPKPTEPTLGEVEAAVVEKLSTVFHVKRVPENALEKVAIAAGYYPTTNEAHLTAGGVPYVAQEAADALGNERVYYVKHNDWGNVRYVGQPVAPQPDPKPPDPVVPPPPSPTIKHAVWRAYDVAGDRSPLVVLHRTDGSATEPMQMVRQGNDILLVKGRGQKTYERWQIRNGKVIRFEDTSMTDKEMYVLSEPGGDSNGGHVWLAGTLSVGEWFRGVADIRVIDKESCRVTQTHNSVVTYRQLAAVHYDMKFLNGITLEGPVYRIINCQGAPDLSRWTEEWLVTPGYGLVGWKNNEGKESLLGELPRGQDGLTVIRSKCI